MDKAADGGKLLASAINNLFKDKEPWQIVVVTTGTVVSTIYLFDLLNQDECKYNTGKVQSNPHLSYHCILGVWKRLKKSVFKLSRKIPAVKRKIQAAMDERKKEFEHDLQKNTGNIPYTVKLPFDGLGDDAILKKVDDHLSLGNYKWQEGRVSGAVYFYDPKLVEFVQTVYGKASYTNPLHSDIFPGVCKMEAEVIRMTANLFHGSESTCGTMTTGGTESLIMACKAYRDYARYERNVSKPNIVMPVTAHCGFDKAAQYLGLYVKNVKVDTNTWTVDLRAMENAINSNTVMLIGSAPNFPYGTMDNIEGIAKLGLKYNIPVHVDACLGGFLIAFMRRAGYQLPPFDFALDGVTSMSADTHKYGFAPKGSSVILYSDVKYLNHQFTVTTDWPGGIYGSPTVNGSRAGGVIAATWATMLRFGEDGYTEATKSIIDTTKYLEGELRKLKNIFIFGTPATSVVAIGSKDFDIFLLSGALTGLGWNLNNLQFPSGMHICITYMHTKEGVADQLLKDIREQVAIIMQNPSKPVEGRMAVYGMAQSLPDRSLVGDLTKQFLNSMYFTPRNAIKN